MHSSVANKQPIPSVLEVGEIAVNNSSGNEFLSIKNSDSDVVRFSSDEQMVDWMEKKEVIPYSGTVTDVNLNTNESKIEIKLNQRVASDTPHSSDVNSSSGASFSIDMSKYAMTGANPSFSSVTTDSLTVNGSIEVPITCLTTNNVADAICEVNNKVDSIVIPIPSALTITYGDPSNSSNVTYDTTSSASTVIPKTISDITSGVITLDNNCLSINKDLCITGDVTATKFYSTSDINRKENIKFADFAKQMYAHNVPIKQFNLKDDPSKLTSYGVIAQEVEANNLGEIVFTDEHGFKSVDYTSLMILKIAFLENEIIRLNGMISELNKKIEKKD